jgi:hypothetical protein
MAGSKSSVCVLAVAALIGSIGAAYAADAGRAWGTVGNPGQAFLNSALTQQAEGQNALAAEFGRNNGGPFRNVTACGTCTTITIQGNQNTVSGNSITSTNFGAVSSTGNFFCDGPP